MKEKIKFQKGFIQIPLLVIIIASIVAMSVGIGIILHKQGNGHSFLAPTLIPTSTSINTPTLNSTPTPTPTPTLVPTSSPNATSAPTPTSTPITTLTPTPTPTPSPNATPTVTPFMGTEVSGVISSNTTWALKDSPYTITGNILILEGSTLTIEPGVKVQFKKHPLRFMGYDIQVDGTLIAKGTDDNKIIFTSNNATPGDWGAIYFSDKSTGSIIDFCIIEYGGASNTMIVVNNALVSIKNSVLRLNGSSGVRGNGDILTISKSAEVLNNKIQDGSISISGGSPYFSGNKISGSNGFRIYGGSPTITKNDIMNNYGDSTTLTTGKVTEIVGGDDYGGGIKIDGGSPIITYNNITGNLNIGISFRCGDYNCFESGNGNCNLTVEHNNIYDNKKFSILLSNSIRLLSNSTSTFNLPNNWWGTTDTSAIDSSIYDYQDDFNLGKVNYQPIVTSKIPDAGVQP